MKKELFIRITPLLELLHLTLVAASNNLSPLNFVYGVALETTRYNIFWGDPKLYDYVLYC